MAPRDRTPKTKICPKCGEARALMYRVKTEEGGPWWFVCEGCLLEVKTGNTHYVYGGTWKGSRH